MKFKTQWNGVTFPNDKAVEIKPGLQPSKTVPGQAMPISEVIRRFASGINFDDVTRTPMYSGDLSPFAGIDLKRLDLAEREEVLEKMLEVMDSESKKREELRSQRLEAQRLAKQEYDEVKAYIQEKRRKESEMAQNNDGPK